MDLTLLPVALNAHRYEIFMRKILQSRLYYRLLTISYNNTPIVYDFTISFIFSCFSEIRFRYCAWNLNRLITHLGSVLFLHGNGRQPFPGRGAQGMASARVNPFLSGRGIWISLLARPKKYTALTSFMLIYRIMLNRYFNYLRFIISTHPSAWESAKKCTVQKVRCRPEEMRENFQVGSRRSVLCPYPSETNEKERGKKADFSPECRLSFRNIEFHISRNRFRCLRSWRDKGESISRGGTFLSRRSFHPFLCEDWTPPRTASGKQSERERKQWRRCPGNPVIEKPAFHYR